MTRYLLELAVLLRTVIGPVTPAMHRGWAPKKENTKAAMKEESSTSATPYCCVVSMRSKEKAIPGRTLQERSRQAAVAERTEYPLGKENKDYGRYHPVVQRV